LFKKFGKDLADLFKEKFDFKKQVKVKQIAQNGITVETTGEAQKSGDYSGNIKGSYKQPDFGLFEVELNTLGATNYSVKADKLSKGLTVKVSGDEKPSAKAEVDYQVEMYSASLGLEHNPGGNVVETGGALGYEGVSVGGSVKYDISGGNLTDYNGGVEYTQPRYTTTVKTANQASKLSFTEIFKYSAATTLGGNFTYDINSGKYVVTAGAGYAFDPSCYSKAKIDSDGYLTTLWEHRLSKAGVKYQLTSEFNVRNVSATPERYGIALIFGD